MGERLVGVLYFAYGSNMCTPRLVDRLPKVSVVGSARLSEWGLSFHKRSVDGSGKCTLHRVPGGLSHGALFELSEGCAKELDRVEGPGYERIEVRTSAAGDNLAAFTYVARASWVDTSLRPYNWYLDLVLAGAREHELPQQYVESTLAVVAVSDPDVQRSRSHQALLADIGGRIE